MKMLLVMRTADGRERPFPLRSDRMVIGREVRCDVRLAVPSVAERHCEVTLDDEGVTLNDLGSDLGTLHNGRRVERATLRHADTLTVGPITFEVRLHHDAPERSPERDSVNAGFSASRLDEKAIRGVTSSA